MTLQASIAQLDKSLATFEDAVGALHVTLYEDRPAGDVPALVDRFDNTATELLGVVNEARSRLQGSSTPDAGEAAAIREVHRLVNYLSTTYWHELAAYGVVARLVEMSQEYGRTWQSWCRVTQAAIVACSVPLAETSSAVLECWSALADRRSSVPSLKAVSTLSRSPS